MANFISDTVTKPTPEMLEAMMNAEVGDDTFGEDPSVNALQEKVAAIFDMEEALFFPSGTMSNQVAIKAHTNPGEAVICSSLSHIQNYEGGGMAVHAGVSPFFVDTERGFFTAEQVDKVLTAPDNVHTPYTTLVSIENTTNKGGGAIWPSEEIKNLSELAHAKGLKTHLDGARLFNALVETGESPKVYGNWFDSISICFSKGLGAPVGSALIGSAEFITKARRIRKVFGGMMRQSGYLAAAASYALDHHVERLKIDHHHAKKIASALEQCPWVKTVSPTETNIIIFTLREEYSPDQFIEEMAKQGHRLIAMDQSTLRITTHLDITEEDVDRLCSAIKNLG